MKQDIFSVSSLVHYLKQTLDQDPNIHSILIKGEISNFTNHRSGHWYFTLKDSKAKLSCVMFASYANRCKIMPKEGMKVIVSASVSMYEAGGSLQMYVTHIQADGLGDLYLQLEQVKKKLEQEGLFRVEHKLPLPQYPLSIGVVSARTGAAIQDILTTIARRWPLADVCVYPSLVQGSNAAADIVRNCQEADKAGHDVILVARGGGAIEDLWCFNEEIVARCIFEMKTVVVTGVGHETDTTLVDYVSDVRAPTPSIAAEIVTPDIQEVLMSVETYKLQMIRAIRQHLQRNQQQYQTLCKHRYLQNPLHFIRESQLRLSMNIHELSVVDRRIRKWHEDLRNTSQQLAFIAHAMNAKKKDILSDAQHDLQLAIQHYRASSANELKEKIQLLDAFSPLKILERGYAITYKDTALVSSVKQLQNKDVIRVRFHDGEVHASIDKTEVIQWDKKHLSKNQ